MRRLSKEAKLAIINKVLCNNGQTTLEIAHANNVGHSTLKKWVKNFTSAEKIIDNQGTAAESLITRAERFKHLQATFGQESVIVGIYCRKNGLYPHQLTQWEADFMTTPIHSKKHQSSAELKVLRAENKQLKHMIVRKDKVLAETVALLVLKKKAAQIWGESQED
ncbi:MAG TPA: transposase [Gammaproteobacteria bacterium]|nr:transposase [Gammaproteobacteria bacterium]